MDEVKEAKKACAICWFMHAFPVLAVTTTNYIWAIQLLSYLVINLTSWPLFNDSLAPNLTTSSG